MDVSYTGLVLLVLTLQCLASDDSAFQANVKDTTICLVGKSHCYPMQWTTGGRLLVSWMDKCLGAQGKTVGSEVTLYDCDEKSELQKWECRNETVLALKGQDLYIEAREAGALVLSSTIGPNNHFVISESSSGVCSRTYREYYTIGGNANGRTCMFPFYYKGRWFVDCTSFDSPDNNVWCATETKFENELWGYCPTNARQNWKKNTMTGAYYQLNTQSALTWAEAEKSCKQQGASLLSITEPHEQAYVTALLEADNNGQGSKLWTGLLRDEEHGWMWSSRRPFRYLNWDLGHPVPAPGQNCGILDGSAQFAWQSAKCNLKLGYICYSGGTVATPTQGTEQEHCSSPWIPYNGHCFFLNRTKKTWLDSQRECRKEGGDLVSIRNIEDQSFVTSQLGYAPTDELWIGLNDRKTERLFDWSDHSTVTFTSWEYASPALSTGQEDCVLMRGVNGNWADRVCNEKHGFICMKTSASEPSGDEVEQNIGCKTGWKRHGSYCYFVGTETKTFDEANDDCKSSNSYLVDVTKGVDNAFLITLVGLRPEKHFWLGLTNMKHIDHFVWTSGNVVKYTHWNVGMPDHHQGCVAMTTGIAPGLWDVLPCTNKEKYICKHLAEGEALTPVPATVPPRACADGWTRLTSSHYCYKLYHRETSKMKTWNEARDYCIAIGGDLLSIHNLAEPDVGRYDNVWIGLRAADPDSSYTWSDGSPVNFQNWAPGEPSNTDGESCVTFNLLRKYWRHSHCEASRKWICQIRAGETPKPDPTNAPPDYNQTSDGWLQWEGNQYYIGKIMRPMEEARQYCQSQHGDLVTINSEAENIFLWKQVSTIYTYFWIGLRVDLDGSVEWMDGSPVVFKKTAKSFPRFSYNDEYCTAMVFYTGLWYNGNCGTEHKFICKRSSSPPVNATVRPTVAPKGGCRPPWKQFGSKCYSIVKDRKLTWEESRSQCNQMNGNLVTISSRKVQVFLMTQLADSPDTALWIGLRKTLNSHASYLWTDGQGAIYFNWYTNNQQVVMDWRKKACVAFNPYPSLGDGRWGQTSCNDTYGYICHRNLDPSLPDVSEPTIPNDYVRIQNNSIKVVTQPMTWDEAKKHCEEDDAQLTSIVDEWSQAYIELMAINLKKPLWIGVNKLQTNGYFRFIDGWRLTLSRWGQDEPSPNKPCVYVDVDGEWRTAMCNQTMSSACKKSTDIPPPLPSQFPGVCPEDPDAFENGKRNYWLPFKGYCYLFFLMETSWPLASAQCISHGGTLASIEDPSEQEFIHDHVKIYKDSHYSFWIGLYKTHKGKWMWLDKTVVDYTNWSPDITIHLPGQILYGSVQTSNGEWRSVLYPTNKPYICKAAKVIPVTPSPTSGYATELNRSRIALIAMMVIFGIAVVAIIFFILFKKKNLRLPIPEKLTAFDNPLFFNNQESQPETVHTNNLCSTVLEEENSEILVTVADTHPPPN